MGIPDGCTLVFTGCDAIRILEHCHAFLRLHCVLLTATAVLFPVWASAGCLSRHTPRARPPQLPRRRASLPWSAGWDLSA